METLRLVRSTPGCTLLLVGNFAVAFGSNLVIPFLAVYLTQELGMAPAVVAMAITAKFWCQQGLAMVGGWFADRAGGVVAMAVGLLVRALAYSLLVFAADPVAVVVACGLIGFGGAIYVPASKSVLVRLVGTGEHVQMLFAMRSTANNSGSALGPLVGSVLLLVTVPQVSFVCTSIIYVSLALMFLRLRPLVAGLGRPEAVRTSQPAGGEGRARRGRLAWLCACAFAFGFCYLQLEYAHPVFAGELHDPSLVGVLFAVNAVAVVLLQVPLNERASRVPWAAAIICGGVLLMAVSFAAAASGAIAGLLVCVLVFSAAEVLVDPRIDREIAHAVPASRRGLAFGAVGTMMGLGGAGANALAATMSSHEGAPTETFWWVLVATASVMAVTLALWDWSIRRFSGSSVPDLQRVN